MKITNRRILWCLLVMALAVGSAVAYMVWGDKALGVIVGALIGLGAPALFGGNTHSNSNHDVAPSSPPKPFGWMPGDPYGFDNSTMFKDSKFSC